MVPVGSAGAPGGGQCAGAVGGAWRMRSAEPAPAEERVGAPGERGGRGGRAGPGPARSGPASPPGAVCFWSWWG